jgi:hypothetical protein
VATHDYVIANGTGAAVRSDLNNALAAIVSNNSSSTAPATTYAYQWWPDTTTGLLKQRNAANSAWITIGTLASTNLGLATLDSPTFTGTPLAPTATTGTNTTQIATTAYVLGQASSTAPVMDGTAAVGVGTTFARADHVHASDTSRAPLASPSFTGTLSFDSGYGSSAVAYGCRAWVNFNGTGTVAIRASGNVSSITDLGVGVYRVNLTTAMTDANYSVIANGQITAAFVNAGTSVGTFAAGSFQIDHVENNAYLDTPIVSVAVFR